MSRQLRTLAEEAWQRLSPWAVILLLISGVATQARQHIPLLLGAGAGIAYAERIGSRELMLGSLVLLAVAALVSLFYYRRFRFRLDGDVLVVQKGLFEHREFKVAASHIQNISIRQPPYMRPFGVVLWRLETTAGESSGIELPGLHRSVADALGTHLSTGVGHPTPIGEAETGAAQPPERQAQLRYAITPWGVTLHGLASRSIYVTAAMLAPLVRPLERWAHDYLPRTESMQWLLASPMLAFGAGVVVLVTVLMTLAIAASWWRFHGYRLREEGERYIQVSGLLQRQEQALSLRRLQVVEWVQTGLGRLLGRGYLVCRQFGALKNTGAEEASQFLIPGLTPANGHELARSLWPDLSAPMPVMRVSPLYRRVLFLRTMLALCIAALCIAWLGGAGWSRSIWSEGGLVIAAVIIVAASFAQLRWRALGWYWQGEYLWVTRGLVGRRTAIFPVGNVISLEVQQSWLQRRRGLVTLHLFLANGRQTLPFLEQSEALTLSNLLLARVESSPAERER
ncbi:MULTISPECIES: PH domain-containing protein [Halomonadaceae]|uniref:PH domain-containing protein n=1 Tax=Halomonadaceae TaxID=28256 RepID=UPI0015984C5A|nr:MULTISPECIES: PH domain-containing protein [Halomonas]QJQ94680.1 PH domain-containing protein [Halomonas sp. PA5]